MEQLFSDKELRALETQLSTPNGAMGIALGHNMHASNIGMTLATIALLKLETGSTVLELGHGNCGHLDALMSTAKDIEYHGLEVSQTMYEEACKGNTHSNATFAPYNGTDIPLPTASVASVFSVNTIYFWEKPSKLLREIERVLKPGGRCIVTYANADFMKKLPFVRNKFKLYDTTRLQDLVASTQLRLEGIEERQESVLSKTGDRVQRLYTLAVMQKS